MEKERKRVLPQQKALQLQRASAGSGKTYALARKYIWLLLTIPVSKDADFSAEGYRRLRTDAELRDSITHILAITFTQKATAEMKSRIVEKLAALAAWQAGDKRPDYLDDFTGLLGCPEEAVVESARKGLRCLLHTFTDFNVSTIDSFFQTILRTFAYETRQSEGYSIEMDDKQLAQESLGDILTRLKHHDLDEGLKTWIKHLMEANIDSSGWNLIQESRHDNDQSGWGTSLYQQVIKTRGAMEQESYKVHQEEIENYFRGLREQEEKEGMEMPLYLDYYERVKAFYEEKTEKLAKALHEAMDPLMELMTATGTPSGAIKSFTKLYNNYGNWRKYAVEAFPVTSVRAPGRDVFPDSFFKRRQTLTDDQISEADKLVRAVVAAQEPLNKWLESEEVKLWRLYKEPLAMMGLAQAIEKNGRALQQRRNALQLSETNSILARIIGKDDAPFIYERVGTIIRHYLIDEFQDTSVLQWNNLAPLLETSVGEKDESLLIGDAKQSIYRFRNAEPSLISTKVPEAFDTDVRGGSEEENTNWRSQRKIVEFNNDFFKRLSEKWDNDYSKLSAREDATLRQLYGQVRQNAHHTAPRGYIEANIFPYVKESGDFPSYYRHFGPLVTHLTQERGYRQSDIAFLVRTRGEGQKVVRALVEYNHQEDCPAPISFLSEESLSVENSDSVKGIVGALGLLVQADSLKGDTEGSSHRYSVTELTNAYSYYRQKTGQEGSPLSALQDFFSQPDPFGALSELMESLQAVKLPSIVETLVGGVLTERQRREEAPYIAAFQDAVLDYCSSGSTDVASFLWWWDRNKHNINVPAPKSAEAVQVMTYHKSKGLEFKVVIFVGEETALFHKANKESWLWLRTRLPAPEGVELPPLLPLKFSSGMKNCAGHRDEYFDEVRSVYMDTLNLLYVGFTRAIDRLYIYEMRPYNNASAEQGISVLKDLEGILQEMQQEHPEAWTTEHPEADEETLLPLPEVVYRQGDESEEREADKDGEGKRAPESLKSYGYSPMPQGLLMFPEEEGSRAAWAAEIRDLLREIVCVEDCRRVMRRREAAGEYTEAEAGALAEWLEEHLGDEAFRPCFSPEAGSQVYTRSDLRPSWPGAWIPDRVILRRDGEATVVAIDLDETTNPEDLSAYCSALEKAGLARKANGVILQLPEREPQNIGREAGV